MTLQTTSSSRSPGSTATDSEVVLLHPPKVEKPHWSRRRPGSLDNTEQCSITIPFSRSYPKQISEQRQAVESARAALGDAPQRTARVRRRRVDVQLPRLTLPQRPKIAGRFGGHVLLLVLVITAVMSGKDLHAPQSVGVMQVSTRSVVLSSSEEHERRPISILTTSAVGGRQEEREAMIPAAGLPPPRQGSAFDIEHKVAPDETLGEIAKRYRVSALSIALSNNLGNGQPLAIGQGLRIPRISGVPHVVEEGETLESIAGRYNVSLAAIIGYGPNKLVAGEELPVGQEIFIPGGTLPLGAGNLTSRNEQELAALRAQPVATISSEEAQIHEGPDTLFEPLAAAEQGVRLQLVARHGNWFMVDHPEIEGGWINGEALEIPNSALASLPEATDIPKYVPTASVRDDATNVRSGPDIFYDTIGTLPAGTRVQLMGQHSNWFKVQSDDGTQGWMAAEVLFVRPEVVATVPDATDLPPPVPIGVVRDNESNLRRGPDTVYESLDRLTGGTRVRLIARHNDWVKVAQTNGEVGWMAAEILDVPPDVVAGLPEDTNIPEPPPVWVWPTYGEFTSGFGWRRYPWRMFHDGIDIANRQGTPIVAARRGTVTEAGWCSGFGWCVKMSHDAGFSTIYGHMMSRPVVREGDFVEAGQLIGYMGSTYDRAGGGYSTGVHLHFTVKRNGVPVNPMNYLP